MAIPVKKRGEDDGYVRPAAPTTAEAPPVVRREIVSDLDHPVVASDVALSYFRTDRALPITVDDIERAKGLGIYEEMTRVEPIVAGILLSAKALTIGDGATVVPSHAKPPLNKATLQQKNDWDLAQKFRDYGQELLKRLEILDDDLLSIMIDQLNALYRGHTLSEMDRGYFASGPFKGRYCIESMRVKPRANYTFILDEMNKFRGITAKMPGVSVMVWHGIIGDASYLANAIAPEKFLILTVGKQYGNPQGVSMFRPLWDPYDRKQRFKIQALKAGYQVAGGMITVVAPDQLRSVDVDDVDNQGTKISLLSAIHNQAKKLGSGGIATFPFGTDIDVHQPSADPAYFKAMFTACDTEMYQGFFGSAEGFLPSERNSQANAETAQDMVVDAVKIFKGWMCNAWDRQVFRPYVSNSFGDEFGQYAPRLSLNPIKHPDFAVNALALAKLVQARAVDDSQLPGFWEEFGYPEAAEDWMERRQEQADRAAASARKQQDDQDDSELEKTA